MAKGKEPDTSVLREIFYDELKGLGKFDKLWRELQAKFGKKSNPFTQKQVKAWLSKQRNVQETTMFKRKSKMFTSVRGKKPGNIFQIDLMFFKRPLGPHKFSGVLNAVDV